MRRTPTYRAAPTRSEALGGFVRLDDPRAWAAALCVHPSRAEWCLTVEIEEGYDTASLDETVPLSENRGAPDPAVVEVDVAEGGSDHTEADHHLPTAMAKDATSPQMAAAVARYHAGCLRVIGAQNVALRDVRTTKKAAICCDVGTLAQTEELLTRGQMTIRSPGPQPEVGSDGDNEEFLRWQQQMTVWGRLRELAAKAAVESHAKEVVYGAPLLVGHLPKKRTGGLEAVAAPLLMQAVTLAISGDGAITVKATDEPPRFNTAVWNDAVPKGDIDQIVNLGLEAQGELAAGYEPELIAKLLAGISSIFGAVAVSEPDGSLSAWPGLHSTARPASPHLELHNGAVLFIANRSSPYLLNDLETIARDPRPLLTRDRPLRVLLRQPSEEERPEAVSPNLDEVVYPFPSNAAQRQVADALDKNRIVVVQGPPGNGKSLTIANLVAHIVATGRTVLVTSHKNQALTVVRDKLAEGDQRFLYASLIGDGGAAKRELQRQIADVKAFASAANRARLETQLEEITARRQRNGKRYAELRDDFIERAELEQEEAARLFERFRDRPTLPVEDEALNVAEHEAAAQALRRLDELARTHAAVWPALCADKISREVELGSQIKSLAAFLDSQEARLIAQSDAAVGSLVAAWQPITDADPDQITKARGVIEELRATLGSLMASTTPEDRAAGLRLADADSLLSDVRRGATELEESFARARELAVHRDRLSVDPQRREQILQQHALLSSMLKKRAARRWLDEHAPGAAGLDAEQLALWSQFWDHWGIVRTHASGLAGGLSTELPQSFDADAAQAVISAAQRAVRFADAAIASREAGRRTTVPLNIEAALKLSEPDYFEHGMTRWTQALAATDGDRRGNQIKVADELKFIRPQLLAVDELFDAGNYDEAAQGLDGLRAVLDALPALEERRGLLDGPLEGLPGAAQLIESAAIVGAPAPAFLAVAEEALRLHPQVLRYDEIASGESTRSLAEELSERTGELMADASDYLGCRIQERILNGFRKPTFLASLEAFRKAIGASPKRFERFEELKNSPQFDIDVLTDVFPCWVMRPEDVCRVFPLRQDVFDVVIFDEASQCNPDQALPLFARGKHALIVGDDKQLSNEDLRRSLSSNANLTLLRQSGLDKLDPVGLFDQTQNSLLELAGRRMQASVLLNEHFRCRPEIIAFSNRQFYGSRLRVIRDRQDDHGLGPALLIRQLEIEDPQSSSAGGKVNHLEAAALIDELKGCLEDPRYEGMSFGILSLFREQIEHLAGLVESEIPERVRESRRLICSTVDGFQGDERDVILYSWRYTAVDHPAVFAFTNGGGGEQRTNVALTRARHQAIHFISAPIDRWPLSAANVTPYLRHAHSPEDLLSEAEARAHREPAGPARQEVRDALRSDGLDVLEDYVACGISVDLLVHEPESGKRLAVFVDADRARLRPPDTPERVDQHALLERAGWSVLRLPAVEVLGDGQAMLGLVRATLRSSPEMPEAPESETVAFKVIPAGASDEPSEQMLDLAISPEDRADYHWDVASVEARLHGGEDVFESEFEREIYSALNAAGNLALVPQWPARGKFIDLVITDIAGRRLAVEADGAQHHETLGGQLIPEDLDRQAWLEEAGWTFVRVAHRDWQRDPKSQVDRILEELRSRPEDAALARKVWGGEDLADVLEDLEVIAAGDLPSEELVELDDEPLEEEPLAEGAEDVSVTAVPVVTAPLDDDVVIDGTATASAVEHEHEDVLTELPLSEIVDAPRVESVAVSVSEAASFDDIPLKQFIVLVTDTVRAHGEVADADLAQAFETAVNVEVPRLRHRNLRRFAWTAKGKGYLDVEGDVWSATGKEPVEDERYGEWSCNAILDRATDLLATEPDPFERLLAEVYAGDRVPKLAMSIVGSAINQARRMPIPGIE